MIDWLEMLWKAAEEETEVYLPGDRAALPADRRARSGAEEGDVPAPAEGFTEEGKREIADGQSLKAGQGRLRAAAMRRAALPDGGGAAERRLSRDADPWKSRGTMERLSHSAADSALAGLYRQVRKTVLPGQSESSVRRVMTGVREEAPAGPGLTEEGLDRSLRRDSRRYDGGMSIY